MYIFFFPHRDPDSQGYKVTELECFIIIHLSYPLLHIQQSQNESTNTFINMVTGKIFFLIFGYVLSFLHHFKI